MTLFRSIAKLFFNSLPNNNTLLNKFSRAYINRSNGDNDTDSSTNGEEFILRKVLPLLVNGVVFDVGANIGSWSKFAISLNSSLNIHLFEPSFSTFKQCTSLSWPKNIIINNFGLGAREETLILNIVGEGMGTNSIYKRIGSDSVAAKKTEIIHLRTIDAYCKSCNLEKINFLKIDVEGHEISVLLGATELLKNGNIDIIQFEYGGTYLDAKVYLRDIIDLLRSYDYNIAKIFPNGCRPVLNYSYELENFQYSNFIASREPIFGVQNV